MKGKTIRVTLFVGVFLSVLVALALAAQDRYTLKVPGGLAFSDFRGYEDWQVVAPSHTDAAKRDESDLGESRDDEGLPGRRSGQWQAFPRRLQDRQDRMGDRGRLPTPLFPRATPDTVPGVLTEVEFIEKNAQAIRGHQRMGIRRVRL